MTTAPGAAPGARQPDALQPDALRALGALNDGIAAARALELDVADAEAVAAEGRDRLGISPDAYVMALVGGTGVGKSTILNALAGEELSPASVQRPTTDRPVAWVAATARKAVEPLLARLGIDRPRSHTQEDLARVVIVDLPDIDSLETEHRAAVEAVLPKIDVVAWVTDPEKYADAVLHDEFLRAWMAKLDRQVVVLNRIDRLAADARAAVARDLGLVVQRVAGGGVPILATAAIKGDPGIAPLRDWIAKAAEAKAIVAARLDAAARAGDDPAGASIRTRRAARPAVSIVPRLDRANPHRESQEVLPCAESC